MLQLLNETLSAVQAFLGLCAHQRTTWPRRADDGKDYVTCLNPYCQKRMLSSVQFNQAQLEEQQ